MFIKYKNRLLNTDNVFSIEVWEHQLEIMGQPHYIYWSFKDVYSAVNAVNTIYKSLDEKYDCIKIGESGGLVL